MKFSISLAAFALLASSSAAQQVMWKDNPITGKVVGLTYGTSGWNAAEAQAVAYGGHLVTVRSQQENQWLKDEFASVWAAPSTLGPWIGLNDVASEGSWAWSSGEAPTQPFLGFVSPEPNGGTLENWVHWQPYSGWSWNDVDEGRANKALIEVQRRPESSWSWSKRISLGTGLYHQSAIDFDADGDMDLAVQDHGHGNVWLLENDGTGTCTVRAQLTTVPWPMNSIGHDWDRDGRLDILVTSSCYSWQGGNVYLLRQNASGSFENAVAVLTASEPWDILAADVSGDGNVDMVVSSFAPNSPLRIYVANAAGSLPSMPTTVVQTNFPDQLFVSGADLDGDFDIDLVVGGNQQFAVLPNGGGGVFGAPMVFGGACARPLMCDVDGDGDADIVQVRSSPASIVVWRNLGALQFVSDPAIALQVDPTTADFADFDLDGDWDLVAGSLYADRLDVFHNNGLGVFVSKAVLLENSYAVGVLCADMNNDRKMDITAVNHYGQNVAIILNQAFQDCDANGVDDYGSIANGTAPDCNVNGRPDSCDFALGLDSDGNGILDGCEPTLVSLSPAMRPAFTAGVVSVATTNVPDGTATLTLSSPGFGQPIVRTFAIANNAGSVTLPALGGPSASDVVASGTISFTDALGNTVVTDVTPDVFTWDVPRIVAASPSNAPFDQTTGVVFTLEDHVATSGFGTAKFGNSPAQSAFLFTSAGQRWVSTIAPAQPAPGPVDVLLQFGNEFTLAQRGFVFLGPGVTNLSATSGWQAGGEALDVELYGFAPNVPVDVIFGSGAGAVSVAAVPNGVAAQSFLYPREHMTRAAAASLRPDEFPAVVTAPSTSGLITGSDASFSRELLRRGCSSVVNSEPSGRATGTSSFSNRPSSIAWTARRCDSNAQASASSRVTPAMRAVLSPTVSAMLNGGASSVSSLAGGNQNVG